MSDYVLSLGLDASAFDQGTSRFEAAVNRVKQQTKQLQDSARQMQESFNGAGKTSGITEYLQNLGKATDVAKKQFGDFASHLLRTIGLLDETGKSAKHAKEGFGELKSSVQEVGGEIGRLIPGVGGLTSIIGGSFVAALAAAGVGLIELIHRQAEAAEEIRNMSDETGIGVEMLQRINNAAARVGVGTGAASRGLEIWESKLVDAVSGNQKLRKEFESLGVDVDKAIRNPNEAFNQFLKGMGNISTEAGKVATAKDLMGRSGAQLTRVINELNAETEKEQKLAKETGEVLGPKQIGILSDNQEAWEKLGLAAKGAANLIALGAAPAMTAALEDITGTVHNSKNVWRDLGVWIGDVMAQAIAWIKATGAQLANLINGLAGLGKMVSAGADPQNAGRRWQVFQQGKAEYDAANKFDFDTEYKQQLEAMRFRIRKITEAAGGKGEGGGGGLDYGRPDRAGKGGGKEELSIEAQLKKQIAATTKEIASYEDAHVYDLRLEEALLKEQLTVRGQINAAQATLANLADAQYLDQLRQSEAINAEAKTAKDSVNTIFELQRKMREDAGLRAYAQANPLKYGAVTSAGYKGFTLDQLQSETPTDPGRQKWLADTLKKLTDDYQNGADKLAKIKAEILKALDLSGASKMVDPAKAAMDETTRLAEKSDQEWSKLTTEMERFVIRTEALDPIGAIMGRARGLTRNDEGLATLKALQSLAITSQSAAQVRDYRESMRGIIDSYKSLTDWQKMGLDIERDIKLTDEDRVTILDELRSAQAASLMIQEAGRIKAAYMDLGASIRSTLQNAFYQGLVQGPKAFFQTLLQGFAETMAKLASELFTSAFYKGLISLRNGVTQNGSSGGGFWGTLLNFAIGIGASAFGSWAGGALSSNIGAGSTSSYYGGSPTIGFDKVSLGSLGFPKAEGGDVGSSGFTMVGERGPEMVWLNRGNYVQNAESVKANRRNNITVVVNVNGVQNPSGFSRSRDQMAAEAGAAINRAIERNG